MMNGMNKVCLFVGQVVVGGLAGYAFANLVDVGVETVRKGVDKIKTKREAL